MQGVQLTTNTTPEQRPSGSYSPHRVQDVYPNGITTEEILSTITFSSVAIEEIVRYFLSTPGKRIRSALVYLSASMIGRPAHHVKEAAAIIELLHNGTLIHDDVIDKAHLRRGHPTVNRVWGDAVGILIGDCLLAYVMDLAKRIGVASVSEVISSMLVSLVEGQMMELNYQHKLDLEKNLYLEIVEKKTASLFAGACTIGGILAGGASEEIDWLESFGRNLGMAFQMIDDCLDYQGSTAVFGKEIGKDFIEGKITLPLIFTYRNATSQDRRRLQEVARATERERYVPMVQSLIRTYRGIEETENEAYLRTCEAVAVLDPFTDGPVRRAMEALANDMATRLR